MNTVTFELYDYAFVFGVMGGCCLALGLIVAWDRYETHRVRKRVRRDVGAYLRRK